MLENSFKGFVVAPYSIVLVKPPQLRAEVFILLLDRFVTIFPAPVP